MTRAKKGERVGAIKSVTDGVARFYGYGRYVGDEVPGDGAGVPALWGRDFDDGWARESDGEQGIDDTEAGK